MKGVNERVLEEYERYLISDEKSSNTVKKYIRDIRTFLKYARKKQITKELTVAYKGQLIKSYRPRSVNSMLSALNSFLKYLGAQECCVKFCKVQREIFCGEEKELTRTEYLRLVNAAENSGNRRLSLILQTICATGIRVSELEYITVEALERGMVSVSSKNKSRSIFLVKKLRRQLRCYASDMGVTQGPVFITGNGTPLDRTNIWRELKSICGEAGVDARKVFPHNLRHLFARTFYNMEKDIVKLADILGHSSINTTRIYVISTGSEHRRKMENMRLVI